MPTRPNDQAFPTPAVYADGPDNRMCEPGEPGLTIREEFAKAIMAGLAANGTILTPDDGPSYVYTAKLAAGAVRWADALIAALNAEPAKE